MLLVKLSRCKFHIFTTLERYKAHSPQKKYSKADVAGSLKATGTVIYKKR